MSLASPRKASRISYNQCFGYSYKSNCIRITENDVPWGQTAVTTVITIGFPLMPQKQGAVKQQGQCERAVVAKNRGSVVLFWVPILKEAVPLPPPRASPLPRIDYHSLTGLGAYNPRLSGNKQPTTTSEHTHRTI